MKIPKLPWIAAHSARTPGTSYGSDAGLLYVSEADLAEADRILALLRVRESRAGLEARILSHLAQQPATMRPIPSMQSMQRAAGAFYAACVRGWTPAALVASLLCVAAGGVIVSREAAIAVPAQTVSVSNRPGADRPVFSGGADRQSLAAAAARLTPAGAVPAGRIRSRDQGRDRARTSPLARSR